MGVLAAGAVLARPAWADEIDAAPPVPSGHEIYLQEVLMETRLDASRVARFRYVMPLIRQGVEFPQIEFDFPHLCEIHAAPEVARLKENVDQVIISIADREVEFGSTSSLATQYFEAYRLENGVCIWEGF